MRKKTVGKCVSERKREKIVEERKETEILTKRERKRDRFRERERERDIINVTMLASSK